MCRSRVRVPSLAPKNNMQNFQENLPNQNVAQYIQELKEGLELPIQKSGIELAASIVNITSSAKLILEKNLNYNPDVFDHYHFEQQRLALINNTPQKRQVMLEQFTLSLSSQYKDKLEVSIENFLFDFSMYFNKNTLNACWENSEYDIEYIIFEDSLYELIQPEIDIQNAYDTYIELKDFLSDIGVEEESFDEMTELIERENNIRYTTH